MPESIPVVIKTTHNDPALLARRDWFLTQPGCIWAQPAMGNGSLPTLMISRLGAWIDTGGQRLAFHPSMALLRLLNIFRNNADRFLTAAGLQPGDVVLDATLGLATDALVAAWAVGAHGRVIGVESSPVLAALVRDGLSHLPKIVPQGSADIENSSFATIVSGTILSGGQYRRSRRLSKNDCSNDCSAEDRLSPYGEGENRSCTCADPKTYSFLSAKQKAWQALAEAAERIDVIWADHFDFLSSQPADSVDVGFFDPMFRHTRRKSASIQPLHGWSDHRPLQQEAVHEACRVARRRLVLKERKNSKEFARLGFRVISGGKYSAVDYGVIDVN